ncbi:MAG: hypothetical protein K8R44_01905, partial [Sulfurimonas sp.]|nr:hypothetical protein [Sulfurimonas sp.]
MKIKIKIVLLSLLVLFIVNTPVYMLSEWNSAQRVENVLKDKLETLEVNYDILLHTQKTIASAMYKSTVHVDRLIEIMSQAGDANEEERAVLRNELHKLLEYKYEIAKEKGVLQYQFVLPNNISFLRMHKPIKFGDDLTVVRDDFRYTNKTQKPVRGFTQGKTAHGFRNVFPIFDKDGKHIGAMEISFSSDSFQWSLNNISHIHTHFLVDKDIFDAKTWQRD